MHEDSFASFIVNIILAFLIVKFLVYPGIGLIVGTNYPVVAVVSGSMEHTSSSSCLERDSYNNCIKVSKTDFNMCGVKVNEKKTFSLEDYLNYCGNWYEENFIPKQTFFNFPIKNGFNKGDIIALYGTNNINIGDIIVFKGTMPYPIIHRVVKINEDGTFQTKGDNNFASREDEKYINKNNIYGKAYLKIPWFGWVKITAVCGISSIFNRNFSFIGCMRI